MPLDRLRSLTTNVKRQRVRLLERVADVLVGIDRRRRARWEPSDPQPKVEDPDFVLAVIAHWRPETSIGASTRMAYLREVVDGLLELEVDHVTIVVLSNDADLTARELREHVGHGGRSISVTATNHLHWYEVQSPRDVRVVQWRPGLLHRHGFYLPWGHVSILRDAARSGRFSHFIYLEDDIRFTDSHLRYWSEFRTPLAKVGLLPGFVRYEESAGERYVVDQLRPVDPGQCNRSISGPTGNGSFAEVVCLPNPYQAMYVLDRGLAEEHFRFSVSRSLLRSRHIRWKIRERAAAGPIFDDVPSGLASRSAVPLRWINSVAVLDERCLLEHLAGNYSRDPLKQAGSLRLAELFASATQSD